MRLYCKHMKSTVRIKKINGKEYWYEDIPYYDKEKKQIRHRSKYLGKNISGKPVKVREELNRNPDLLTSSTPRHSFNYGELLPVSAIINDLQIDTHLDDLIDEMEKDMLITLSINRIVRPTAMHNIKTWYEGSALSLEYPELPLTSQNISEQLKRIGDSNIPTIFMGKMMQKLGTKSTLMYDITSLSSYSKPIDLFEFGYSRDDPSLPQINLSIILDKKLGIPVMYDIYPGSIVDVTTLKNTIRKIEAFGVKDYTLVMDRGFFSEGNLKELLNDELSFIIPATYSLKSVKELMSKAQKEVKEPQYLQKYNKNPIFAKPVTLTLDGSEVEGYCYYDPKREQDERNSFYNRLYDIMEHVQEKAIPKWKKPFVVFKEIAKEMANYLKWTVVDDHFEVTVKKNAVTQRVNRMGSFLIFYNGKYDWMTCLSTYRDRDALEKGFDILKNDLKALPLNAKTESTIRGLLFVDYLSLVVRMRLINQMRENGLLKNYTVEKLLLELEKIKKIQLANGDIIVTEVTKKQNDILKKLDLCA